MCKCSVYPNMLTLSNRISTVNGHHPFATMSVMCYMYGMFSTHDHWNNLHDITIMNIPCAYLSVVWMCFAHSWHGSSFPSCRTLFYQSFNNVGNFFTYHEHQVMLPLVLSIICSSMLARILACIITSNRLNANTYCKFMTYKSWDLGMHSYVNFEW